MTDIEQRVRIIKRLESFKFELKPNSDRNGRMDFVRDGNLKGSEALETLLSLNIHNQGRVSLKLHSNPWPKFYRFSIRDISERDAILHVRRYLTALGRGEKYTG